MPSLLCVTPYRQVTQVSQDLSWASVALLLHADGTHGSTTLLDEVGNTYTSSGAVLDELRITPCARYVYNFTSLGVSFTS